MSSINNPWLLLGVTMVGIVTAVSAFVVEIIHENKRKASLNRDLCDMRSLRDQVSRLQLEITHLTNAQQNSIQARRQRHLNQEHRRTRNRTTTAGSVMSVTSDADWKSAQDSSDLEFYDLSSDDDESKVTLDVALETIDNRLASHQNESSLMAIKSELEQLFTESTNQGDILWRLAKCEYKLSQIHADPDNKSHHIRLGLDYCEQSADMLLDTANPSDQPTGQLNKWLAICLGAQLEQSTSSRDKIRSSIRFKRALDAAAHHMPHDGTVQYMLGRWALEVGALSWLDRKALSLIAGADVVGEVGAHAALEYLQRANGIEDSGGDATGSREIKVCLAKALLEARNDVAGAVKHLLDAQRLPSASETVDIELKTLLAKYNSYT